jgi:hypothetical protein
MTATTVRALLDGLIDYAGLFPPAALPMADAVANYAAYLASPDAWALGRFVLPVTRLDDFAAAAEPHRRGAPWRLSVLAQAADAETIRAFNARLAGRAVIEAVEAKAQTADDVAALAPLAALGTVYAEIPVHDDPDPLVRAIGAQGLRAKLRTGGVTTDVFPAPDQVVRFLVACMRQSVTFKATAGLHHPLRGEYPLTYESGAEHGVMFGFLNVFLAALFIRQGMSAADAAQLLDERDAAAIEFDATCIRWRTFVLPADALAGRARFAASFGSCSFREPIDDLSALHLT